LQQAISQLTEDQQQVLMLKFFADMTNNEIALQLGRTEGAIKALQHRALHALQQIIDREAREEPMAREYGAIDDANGEWDDPVKSKPASRDGLSGSDRR